MTTNIDKSPILNEKNSSQSTGFITRTSDDSTRQYISASESPFFTASSVVSNKMSASGTTTTPTVTSLQQTIYQPTPAHQNTKTPEKQTNNKEFILTPKENTTFTSNNTISSIPKPQQGSSAYEVNLQDFPKPPPSLPGPSKSDEPLLKKSSNVPLVMPIPTKKKTSSRPPTSSSGSSATVGHDVTHASVNGYINNNDKPPENIVSPAFLSQNSNKNTMSQAVNTVDAYTSIQELLKREMKKMALNEDLQELKRAVEQMQQDRLLDLQENSTRFEQQKLTDIAMWEHINMANEKLSKLIQDAEAMQKQKHSTEEPKTATPTLKSSNSTNTTRTNRSRASSNEFTEAPRTSQRQKSNRRSFPAVPNNPRLMNDYFPDMKDRPPEFDFMMVQQYPPYAFYPPTQEYEEARFGDPYQESPRSRRSGRQQRSKSMDPPQWVPAEMMDERNPYLPFPPPDQQMRPMFMDMPPRTLSRKSSFHSAKSDDDEPNTNKNDKNGGKQRPHDSGVDDRMRRRYRPPMIPLDDNGLPPMYSNGTAPGAFGPLPPHFAMEPPYGYPPPPGNEYFSYMSPRMMFDEQEQNNGQQKLPQKQPPPQQQQQVWGSNPGTPFWGYALPPHQKQEHKLKEGSLRRNGKTTQQAMPVRYPMYADALHF